VDVAIPFVPDDFSAPLEFEGDGFRLEPLGPRHNTRDHEAWMSSIDHIKSTPGFEGSDWPAPMSLEANLADLERHARDFSSRGGFTYSMLAGEEVIGCLYIYPGDDDRHDASVASWVRESRSEMDAAVRRAVAAWLAAAWPFENPRYASGG
jgi:hypothetical protein